MKQLWRQTEPLPASAQEPLFHATQEAEKVLHYLETVSPGHLLCQVSSLSLLMQYPILLTQTPYELYRSRDTEPAVTLDNACVQMLAAAFSTAYFLLSEGQSEARDIPELQVSRVMNLKVVMVSFKGWVMNLPPGGSKRSLQIILTTIMLHWTARPAPPSAVHHSVPRPLA